MNKTIVSFLIILALGTTCFSQSVILLYTDSIPNSIPHADEEQWHYNQDSILIISKISKPTLTIFLPPKNKRTGTAVIICSGGGYWVIASKHEGTDVAKRFNEMGVAAFVLSIEYPIICGWLIQKSVHCKMRKGQYR